MIAQLVEQRTENPCVDGSIPPRATKKTVVNLRFATVFAFYKQSDIQRFDNF